MALPWWTLSPSPWTIAVYTILALYAARKLYRVYGHNYKRLKRLAAFTDATFMLGFVVLTLDTFWLACSGLRFGWTYPSSVLQLLACLFRNFGIVALCYIFVKDYLVDRATSKTFYLFAVNMVFMVIWFVLAPSPAYTDWTFALRNGYSLATVVLSFFISHVLGKTLLSLTYITYFRS